MPTPSAALTIAATLLGGATEQTIWYFTQPVTPHERQRLRPNDAVNASDDVAEGHVV
jgi:hypothetical protein